MASAALATLFGPQINFPPDFNTNFLMLVRWIHFLAGITWIGLLYFFNLVNVPLMKELDPTTKGKVMPALMTRALWWFRMSAALTVLAGLIYWGKIVAVDAQNGGGSSGPVMGSFFVIWTIVWGVLYACLIPGRGVFDKGAFVGVMYAVVVAAAAWIFLSLNSRGWESNRLLSIGIGGGIGWVMLLNVWGVIWRIQKRLIQWIRDNATNGTPIPDKAKGMARQAFLASPCQCVPVGRDVVFHGRREPLSDVREMRLRRNVYETFHETLTKLFPKLAFLNGVRKGVEFHFSHRLSAVLSR